MGMAAVTDMLALSCREGVAADRRSLGRPSESAQRMDVLLVGESFRAADSLDAYARYLVQLLGGRLRRYTAPICGHESELDAVARASVRHAIVVIGQEPGSAVNRLLHRPAAGRLAAKLSASVLVVGVPLFPIRRVLAVTRGRESDNAVAEWAACIVRSSGADLTLLLALPELPAACHDPMQRLGPTMWRGSDTPIGRQIAAIERRVPEWASSGRIRVRAGASALPARRAALDLGADLIVVGPDDSGWLGRRLNGSIARTLLGDPSPPVLVARDRPTGRSERGPAGGLVPWHGG